MQHYHSPAKLSRPSTPAVALRASFPLPRSCDKRHRECAEPTFTTAGTSKASLLNPVSNGYQHRASNVIRPAAAATSLSGEPVRARARSPYSTATRAGKHRRAAAGLPFPQNHLGSMSHSGSESSREVPRDAHCRQSVTADGRGPWRSGWG